MNHIKLENIDEEMDEDIGLNRRKTNSKNLVGDMCGVKKEGGDKGDGKEEVEDDTWSLYLSPEEEDDDPSSDFEGEKLEPIGSGSELASEM